MLDLLRQIASAGRAQQRAAPARVSLRRIQKERGRAVKFLNFNAALFFIMRAKFYAPEFCAPEFLASEFLPLEFSAPRSSPPEFCKAEFLELYFFDIGIFCSRGICAHILPLEFSPIKFILWRILNPNYAPYYFITSSRVIYVKFHLLKICTKIPPTKYR